MIIKWGGEGKRRSEIKGWKWKREIWKISKRFYSGLLLLCYHELPVFTATPKKIYRLSPIDRSIAADSWNRLRRFKENITSTTMYTDIKRKRNYQYITTLFYKRKTRKKNRIETVFTSFPIYPHSSMILFFNS